MIRNAISIHLEEWFHTGLFAPYVQEDRQERRIEWATEPILALLERQNVQATFFVLGNTMRQQPELVRRIYDAGHEIGCYGWRHRALSTLAPERFRQDLIAFDRDASEILPVNEIVGYRAPGFSLNSETAWALDYLQQHGYRYDSSLYAARTPNYGVVACPPRPYRPTAKEPFLDHPQDAFWEFPLTVYQTGGLAFPIAGGVYLRAMPASILKHLLAQINRNEQPFVLYLHPWEADRGIPLVPRMPPWQRMAGRLGNLTLLSKLEFLLGQFEFGPLRQVLDVPCDRAESTDQL